MLCVSFSWVLTAHATFPFNRIPIANSVHDFARNGFTGGGACAACHIPHAANAPRLYPGAAAAAGFADSPRRQCMDCHNDPDGNGFGTLPATAAWAGYTGRLPPAAGLHALDVAGTACSPAGDAGQTACTAQCHRHDDAFVAPPCLDCHTAATLGTPTARGDIGGAVDADGWFENVGHDGTAGTEVWSQHNVNYAVDSNAVRREGPDANQCKHCHGLTHPSDGDLLRIPAPVPATPALGTPVARACTGTTQNVAAYQNFCLACHGGLEANATFPVSFWWPAQAVLNTRLSGPIGASGTNQLPPSLRTNPAQQQPVAPATGLPTTAGGWVVPAVPPRDINAAAPARLTVPPYFQYYTLNGHGAAQGIELAMGQTCLSRRTGTPLGGCHDAHGTTNRFLVSNRMGSDLDTVQEFAQAVCYFCHTRANLSSTSNAVPPRPGNLFHTWQGPDVQLFVHDAGNAATSTGLSQWREITQTTQGHEPGMDINDPFQSISRPAPWNDTLTTYVTSGVLPFYANAAAGIQARIYTRAVTSPTGNWVMCLTCHDPHGTSTTQTQYDQQTTTFNTRGMPRVYPLTFYYDDALCSECHSEAP